MKDWKRDYTRNITSINNARINKLTSGVFKYHSDSDKINRLDKGLCRYCYYINTDRIGGSVVTQFDCRICGKEEFYVNTDTDNFCLNCAIEHKLCKHCGAEI
jgi:hypothetical protein